MPSSASVSAALALNFARQYLWRHMTTSPQAQHKLPLEQDEEEINVDAETETEAEGDETEAN